MRAKAPIIYVIRNNVTGKQYVGQTRCGLRERWRKHWRRAEANKGACRALSAAIRKYGKDAFTYATVRTLPLNATQQEIDEAEKFAIRFFGTLSPNGYNLIDGGKGGRPSAETLARRSAALKGRPLTAEHRQKLSQAQAGRKRTSPAEIAGYEQNAAKRRGVPRPADVITKGIETRKGKPRSEAQKAAALRHSQFMKGRVPSPEQRTKQSESLKSHLAANPRSEETKRKMSESQKRRRFRECQEQKT